MRTFDERKEEIFRRSEERIARRKKNMKRIVVTCVPLVLCVTVLTGFLTLGGYGKDESAPEAPWQGAVMDSVANGSGIHYGAWVPESAPGEFDSAETPEMTVQDGDGFALELYRESETYSYQDQEILSMFQSILKMPLGAEISGSSEAWEETNYEASKDALIKGGTYAVALVSANGEKVWYSLQDTRLTRLADGQIYTLTQEQATILHKLLEVKWP